MERCFLKMKKKQAQKKNRYIARSIISDEIYLPNHSGMHDAGKVQKTPVNDFDIVNKKYIDNQGFLTSVAYNDLTGNPSDRITAGTNLTWNGDTLNASGGSGSPGGSNMQIQFNDGGSFAGDTALLWDKTNNRMSIGKTGNPAVGVDMEGAHVSGIGMVRFKGTAQHGFFTLDSTTTGGESGFLVASAGTLIGQWGCEQSTSKTYWKNRVYGTQMLLTLKSNGDLDFGNGTSAVFTSSGKVRANSKFNINGTDGATGTFTSQDGKTISVSGGIITSIV